MFPPERIVCLTEETVETLYLLGEERRIVGVSGYAVRPARVRKEKPRVSAFISADFEKVLALDPDLVLTFSDLQADIAAELIRRSIAVHAFNHRDVAGIFDMVRTLGALVGASGKADALARTLQQRLDQARTRAAALARRPRVYFEEWDEPMISGIRWVAELIEIAGGIEVFPALSRRKNARERIVSLPELIAAAPDIIVGSWCGKKFVPAKVAARPGAEAIPAVRDGFLREIKSPRLHARAPRTVRAARRVTQALRWIHAPDEWSQLGAAQKRFRFEEALVLQLVLARRRAAHRAVGAQARAGRDDGLLAAFDARLPFELTGGQREIGELVADRARPRRTR